MDEILTNERIAQAVEQQQSRLRNFIRRRVPDREDAEDILQDVFYELVVAYRLLKPVEQVSAWLFRVARNRIVDLFRNQSRKVEQPTNEEWNLEDMLPSPDGGPEAIYVRSVMRKQLEAALAELPAEQREVFLAHEFEGLSFADMSARTGVGVNTLLSRKRYAVLHLRERLEDIYDETQKGGSI